MVHIYTPMQAKYIYNKINNPKKENREIFKGTVSKGIIHHGRDYGGCREFGQWLTELSILFTI